MRVVCVCEIEMKGLLRGALPSPRTARFLFCHLVCLIEEKRKLEKKQKARRSQALEQANRRMNECFFFFPFFFVVVCRRTHTP